MSRIKAMTALLLAMAISPALGQSAPMSWGRTIPVTPTDAAAIRDAIGHQLSGFATLDGGAAYANAAPNIRRLFPTPEGFMAMARSGYAPLFQIVESRFVSVRGAAATEAQAQTWSQTIALVTQDGQAWDATYGLERQPNGAIAITSCVILKVDRSAA